MYQSNTKIVEKDMKKLCCIKTVVGAVSIPVALLNAQLLSVIVQSAASGSVSGVVRYAAALLSVAILSFIILTAAHVFLGRGELKAVNRLKLRFLEKFLKNSPDRLFRINYGELIENLTADMERFTKRYTELFPGIFSSLMGTVGYFLYCVGSISWIMAFLMLVIPAVKLGVPAYFKEKLAAYDRTEKEYEAKRRDYETDLVYRAYIARLWNIGSGLRERIDRLFREYYDQSAGRQVTCRVLSERIQALTEQASMVLLLLAGAVMVAQGKVSPGEFASLFVYLSVAQTFFRDAGEILENYPLLLNAAERVSKFYQDEEKTGEETAEYFTGLSGEKLSFSYAERKILSDLDFQIKAGEKVRICGENGRGKSTLLKILCTSLENYEGVIQIGDADLRTVNKESWRSEIAYAPQTPFLFCDTVRENLLADYGDEAKRLMEQFGIAHLAERIICADSDLSGGERQKISLVRTFLKDSSVLILDEPSNHLDQESTRILREYLNRSKKTVILVTHDDALADLADRCIQI